MKCEECLAVVEEYFDGELETEAAGRVGAHLSACAGCAAAHEGLEAERALYLRYDRGLEVTPALWQNVRAEIARLEAAEAAAPQSSARLAGLRGFLSAAFAALTLRPAYASSLALLVLGATVGALWYGKAPGPQPYLVVNDNPPPAPPAGARAESDAGDGSSAGAGRENPNSDLSGSGGMREVTPPSPRHADSRHATSPAKPRVARTVGGATAGAPEIAAASGRVPEADHLDGRDLPPAVMQTAGYDADDPLADAARLLDPEEKEVARHVERAQMLLRSFKNTRAAGGDATVNVAYEKNLSRKLLAENAALQIDADAAGDKQTRRVLDTIQPFLLDIANMRDDPSREEVRSIRERMRKTEIIASLQVH